MHCFACYCFFFFSSRRRHTRCLSDWSSDVCSSDLYGPNQYPEKVIPLFVTNALDGEPLPLYGEIGRASCGKSVDLGGRRIIKKKKRKDSDRVKKETKKEKEYAHKEQ